MRRHFHESFKIMLPGQFPAVRDALELTLATPNAMLGRVTAVRLGAA